MNIKPEKINIKNDSRGLIAELVSNNNIKEVLLITIKPGETRGNHYHKTKKEWLCIVKGHAELVYTNIKTGKTKTALVNSQEPKLFMVPTNMAHAIKNIGTEYLYVIELSNQIYRKNPDTYKRLV